MQFNIPHPSPFWPLGALIKPSCVTWSTASRDHSVFSIWLQPVTGVSAQDMAEQVTEAEDTLIWGLELLVSLGKVLLQKAKEEAQGKGSLYVLYLLFLKIQSNPDLAQDL